jgi:hypothetical protein
MARNGFKVMDSDMHLTEPADLWQRYIDPAFKEIAPIGLSGGTRLDGVSLPDNRHFLRPPVGKWFKALKAHMESANADYQFAIDR